MTDGGWNYDQEVDDMRGTSAPVARLSSENSVDLPFPWNGGSFGMLTLMKLPSGTEVMFSVTKGQFQFGHSMYLLTTKADQGKTVDRSGRRASNGRTDMMIVGAPRDFMRSLQNAASFFLEVSFYNAGTRQFVFKPAGLSANFHR